MPSRDDPVGACSSQPPFNARCRLGVRCVARVPTFRERAARLPESLRAEAFARALTFRPPPAFSPPPVCLFTVCQAMRAAVWGARPRFSRLFSISPACRFCLLLYFTFDPRAMKLKRHIAYHAKNRRKSLQSRPGSLRALVTSEPVPAIRKSPATERCPEKLATKAPHDASFTR
jgi:hypothetical protein